MYQNISTRLETCKVSGEAGTAAQPICQAGEELPVITSYFLFIFSEGYLYSGITFSTKDDSVGDGAWVLVPNPMSSQAKVKSYADLER